MTLYTKIMRKIRKTAKINIREMHKRNYGYAVLELLFYIAFFVTLSLVVIEAMIIMSKSFKETSIYAEFAQSGFIMERMSREIRGSYDINSVSATDLVLNTKDDTGMDKIVEFLFSGGNIKLLENGVLTGNLNAPNIAITSLVFTQIITTKGKAVKISLTIRDNNDTQGRLLNFYDTITLRGSY